MERSLPRFRPAETVPAPSFEAKGLLSNRVAEAIKKKAGEMLLAFRRHGAVCALAAGLGKRTMGSGRTKIFVYFFTPFMRQDEPARQDGNSGNKSVEWKVGLGVNGDGRKRRAFFWPRFLFGQGQVYGKR